MTTIERDISFDFAAMAARSDITRLGDGAVSAAKKSLLDTIGVALAASGAEPAVQAAIGLARSEGGRAGASLLGYSEQLPATSAAFANGALAHCLDFDDHTPWGQHASSSVVPAALAVAEQRGGVSGPDLIAAIAVGQDIFARLRCHVGWRKDWNLSSSMGVYGATAAASRVLGLKETETQHALGIASQQSCGVMEAVAGTGSDLRGLYAAFSARGAVTATLLAAAGLTGPRRAFEGDLGVFHTYFASEYDREAMLSGLGTDFRGSGTLYKFWPSVGTSHSHIHATVQAISQHALEPEDIVEIRVFGGDYHLLMCTPLKARQAPETLVDAKFSLPFLVALAAVKGTVRVDDFTPQGLRDPRILLMASKIRPIEDPSLNWTLELPPGRVEIDTADGRTVTGDGAGYLGSGDSPATWKDLSTKFRDCTSHAAHPMSRDQIRSVVLLIQDLESVGDIRDIMRHLR